MKNELIAGDTLDFAVTVPAFPPVDGWSLQYRLAPATAGSAVITLQASAEGDGYRVQAGPATTATWSADTYTWSSWVSKPGERYTVDNGRIVIRTDPAALPAGVDGRTPAECTLDAINAEIQARVTGGASLEYTIGTRSLKREPIAALMTLRQQFRLIVARERRQQQVAAGLGNPQRLAVRFR